MKKNELRRIVLEKLKNKKITPTMFLKMYRKVFDTSEWRNAKVIALTLNTDNEIPTYPLIFKALSEGKQIVIPKTFKNKKMIFYRLTTHTKLKKSKFGIWEPVNGIEATKDKIDLIFIPGVAFCITTCQRIGYGGGYFDCYLQDYFGSTISLVQKEQVFGDMIWDSEKFDIPVQKIFVGA